jgi:serine/threonine protein kinase
VPLLENQVIKNPPSGFEDLGSDGLGSNDLGSEDIESEDCGSEVEKLESKYLVGPPLGEGGFGSVYNGSRIKGGEKVAIKYVAKDKIEDWVWVSFSFILFINPVLFLL